jgi:hypothetical protein
MFRLLLAKLIPLVFGVRWRAILKGTFYMGVVLLLIYCYLQHILLARSEIVYKNPAIIEHVRTVRVDGPVRIVTRVVETPGRVEREIIEERGPVSTVKESLMVQTPVFPPAPRASRWIAGIGANPFDYRESRYWAAYGGYSFGGRLDLCGGVNSGRPAVLVMVRF